MSTTKESGGGLLDRWEAQKKDFAYLNGKGTVCSFILGVRKVLGMSPDNAVAFAAFLRDSGRTKTVADALTKAAAESPLLKSKKDTADARRYFF